MVTIQLDESVAAVLSTQASKQGLSLQEYLRQLAVSQPSQKGHHAELPLTADEVTADSVIEAIDAASSGSGSAYRGTYPREVIYLDHD